MTLTTALEDGYRLLAACFYPPTAALHAENCCEHLATLLAPLSPEASQQASEAARLFQESPLEFHAVEHSRLFLGPFKLIAPPYGSVWLDSTKTVMGESTARVTAYYQEFGLQLADDFPELADHLAVELEFLSYLCFRQREAALSNQTSEALRLAEARRTFIAQFVQPWVLPFNQAIIADGEAPLYGALARCVTALLQSDLASRKEPAGA